LHPKFDLPPDSRVNDILSFYKEELAGEDDNYVHMRADLAGKGTIAALEEICEETLTEIGNITSTLAHDPEAASVFNCYLCDYLRFHFSTTRYKLEELLTTQ
jgi:Trichodiene synthase (TRI5)